MQSVNRVVRNSQQIQYVQAAGLCSDHIQMRVRRPRHVGGHKLNIQANTSALSISVSISRVTLTPQETCALLCVDRHIENAWRVPIPRKVALRSRSTLEVDVLVRM